MAVDYDDDEKVEVDDEKMKEREAAEFDGEDVHQALEEDVAYNPFYYNKRDF